MDFDKMLQTVNSLTDKKEELEAELDAKRMECYRIMQKNYNEVVREPLHQIEKLIDGVLSRIKYKPAQWFEARIFPDTEDTELRNCKVILKPEYNHNNDETPYYARIGFRGTDDIHTFDWWFKEDFDCALGYYSNYKQYKCILLTEEKALKIVDACKNAAVALLEDVKQHLESTNSNLTECIETLTNQLSGSTTVEHREDGMVEIHLNGETYIGTLKKE